jgi:hypothetical protein
MNKEIKYDTNWFKKRALKSLRPISSNVWDYSDSLLLYISSIGIEKYEALQETDTPYFQLVTKPEREYLKSIAEEVVSMLPKTFDYIDLGPGTENKEQFFFDECRRQGKNFTYIPVDISEYYLKLSADHAINQNIPVKPIKCSFEELPEVLEKNNIPKFVNIGLTFSNYNPQTILTLLKKIAGKSGFIFINSQMRDRVDMVELQRIYAEDSKTLADDKLKLLGLNPDKDVSNREATEDVKVWCSVVNSSKKLKDRGVIKGDKLLVFQSLRYTSKELETELKKISKKYKIFDIGDSFIAGLIQI